MSDFQPAGHSAFVQELQRLVEIHRAAIRANDIPAMDDAAHDLKTFLYLNGSGRLAEWFASREQA